MNLFICFIIFVGGISFGIVISSEIPKSKPKELTSIEKRNIAIDYMCFEHKWKGMQNFCGSFK